MMRPSNQKSSPSTAAKSVSFAPAATMRLALHINNYTDEEYDACYYSPEEYCQFKADMRRSVLHKMDEKTLSSSSSSSSSETYCLRGIESFTKEGLAMKTIHRRNAWNVVFNKQFEMQSFGGCDDDENSAELIATACADTTRESSILAYQVGLSDARFVQQQQLLLSEQEVEEETRRRNNNAKKVVLSSSLFNKMMSIKTEPIATNKKQRISSNDGLIQQRREMSTPYNTTLIV